MEENSGKANVLNETEKPVRRRIMKCLKNTFFPIKIIFKKPSFKFQADWFLISG